MADTPRPEPPSRARYRAAHRTVSAVLTLDEYDRAQAVAASSDMSLADLLRSALGLQEKSVGEAYERGRKTGHRQAKQAYAIGYRCALCGQPVLLRAGSESAAAACSYLSQQGWHHNQCPAE